MLQCGHGQPVQQAKAVRTVCKPTEDFCWPSNIAAAFLSWAFLSDTNVCALAWAKVGDSLEEFLVEATPDAKLRQCLMSLSEATRTIAFKARTLCSALHTLSGFKDLNDLRLTPIQDLLDMKS